MSERFGCWCGQEFASSADIDRHIQENQGATARHVMSGYRRDWDPEPAHLLMAIDEVTKKGEERLRQIIREELQRHIPLLKNPTWDPILFTPVIQIRCPDGKHDWDEYGPHGVVTGRRCKKCGEWSSV